MQYFNQQNLTRTTKAKKTQQYKKSLVLIRGFFILLNALCAVFLRKLLYIKMLYFFIQTTAINSTSNYFPIGLQLVFAILFVVVMIAGTHLLGPKRRTTDKLQNFESGIEIQGNARQPMAIKYFLVAILFVLFDVEVIFFYPYAVNFSALGWSGFWAVVMFVAFFLCGFTYIIKKGALDWED